MLVSVLMQRMPFIAYPTAAFLTSLVCANLSVWAAGWPWRRLKEGSWMERARRAFPVRIAYYGAHLLPILSALYTFYAVDGADPEQRAFALYIAVLAWLAGHIAVVFIATRSERQILDISERVVGWWRKWAAFWIVHRFHWIAAVGVAILMPENMTPAAWFLLLFATFALYRYTAGDGLRIAHRIGLLRPASSKLSAVLQRLDERTSIRNIRAYELPSLHAAAFAWPTISSVIVTDRALDVLNETELEAICAHEAGHLTEPESIKAARSASVVWLLPLVAAKPLIVSCGIAFYLALLVVIVWFRHYAHEWSKRLEKRADAIALENESEAGAYAHALARIHEANLLPVVMPGAGSTHPHLYDRLVVAGVQPDYPRPKPPSRTRGAIAVLLSLSLAALLWLAFLML
jgi:Zn-dependent protease with chaperone function